MEIDTNGAGTMHTTTIDDRFTTALDEAFAALARQAFVSQSRCVDHLLDLWNASCNPVLRAVLTAALADIRQVNVVRGDDMHAALSVVAIAANVEQCLPVA
jgi:hypothetical protein